MITLYMVMSNSVFQGVEIQDVIGIFTTQERANTFIKESISIDSSVSYHTIAIELDRLYRWAVGDCAAFKVMMNLERSEIYDVELLEHHIAQEIFLVDRHTVTAFVYGDDIQEAISKTRNYINNVANKKEDHQA